VEYRQHVATCTRCEMTQNYRSKTVDRPSMQHTFNKNIS